MAVKVLRRGNSIFPLQITCQKCGALLEVESARDLKICIDPDFGKIPQLTCPICGNVIALYEADRDQAVVEYEREKK